MDGAGGGARFRPALRPAAAAVALGHRGRRQHRALVRHRRAFRARIATGRHARAAAVAHCGPWLDRRRGTRSLRPALRGRASRGIFRRAGPLPQRHRHPGVGGLVGRLRLRVRPHRQSLAAAQSHREPLRMGRAGDARPAVARHSVSGVARRVAGGGAVLLLRMGGAHLARQGRAALPRARGACLQHAGVGRHARLRPRNLARARRGVLACLWHPRPLRPS